MASECFSKLKEMVSEQFSVPMNILSENTNLVEQLNADSIDLVEFIVDIEKEFGVDVPEEKNSEFVVLNRAVSYIDKAIKERNI